MSVEEVIEQQIRITDISGALMDMPEPRGFIIPDESTGIKPQFAKKITALFTLMHWPFINEGKSSLLDDEAEISNSGLSVYAALVEHGKKYVAEVFLANEKDQRYLGSLKAYSVEFPENVYSEGYDDWLMDELAKRVTGVTKETCVGHHMVI